MTRLLQIILYFITNSLRNHSLRQVFPCLSNHVILLLCFKEKSLKIHIKPVCFPMEGRLFVVERSSRDNRSDSHPHTHPQYHRNPIRPHPPQQDVPSFPAFHFHLHCAESPYGADHQLCYPDPPMAEHAGQYHLFHGLPLHAVGVHHLYAVVHI